MEHLARSEPQSNPNFGSVLEPSYAFPHPATTAWSTTIPLPAFVQRLSLLADLRLPCTICLGGAQREHCCRGIIRECSRDRGRLVLTGDDFSLHLIEDHIDCLQLVDRRRGKDSESAIEILGVNGELIARIYSMPDPQRTAVWQDIMDSFAFASAC